MTPREWVDRFNEIDISKMPVKLHIKASVDSDIVVCRADMRVSDIETGCARIVSFSHSITDVMINALNPHDVYRRLVYEALRHEADECITIRGIRPFDPHRGEGR